MKLIAIVIAMAGLPSLVLSQATITEGNLPQIGDHVTIGINWDAPTPGSAGANQTWDHSGLVEEDSEYFDFVEPSTTDWWEDFTESTLSGISWTDTHSYYKISRGDLSAEGFAVPVSEFLVAKTMYDDTEQILPLPYTYGSTSQDDFSGTWWLGESPYPFTGTVEFEADGYGTLILPSGTYHNVVRYHLYREQVNVADLNRNTVTKDQWAWVSSDFRFWLLLMESSYDGFAYSYLTWWDKNPYGATPTEETSWSQVKSLY
ncbi:hypothetical protein H8E52_02530 [bacterium]|nr:hypothetical protein [bacterium]